MEVIVCAVFWMSLIFCAACPTPKPETNEDLETYEFEAVKMKENKIFTT